MKKIIALLLILSLALSLVACGFSLGPLNIQIGGGQTEDRRPARDDDDDEEDEDDDKKKDDGASGFAGLMDPEDEEPEEKEPMVRVMLPVRMEQTYSDREGEVWVETYEYNEQGYISMKTRYKPNGDVYFIKSCFYDAQGRIIQEGGCYYAYDAGGTQYITAFGDEKYEWRLDDTGHLAYYRKEDGSYYEYAYSEDGMSHVRWLYRDDGTQVEYTEVYCDERGNMVSSWRYTADGELLYRTDFVFDEHNRKTQDLYYAFCSPDTVGTSNTYTYDEYGNLLEVVYDGDYYSADSLSVYTLGEVEVTESAAIRLGQYR